MTITRANIPHLMRKGLTVVGKKKKQRKKKRKRTSGAVSGSS